MVGSFCEVVQFRGANQRSGSKKRWREMKVYLMFDDERASRPYLVLSFVQLPSTRSISRLIPNPSSLWEWKQGLSIQRFPPPSISMCHNRVFFLIFLRVNPLNSPVRAPGGSLRLSRCLVWWWRIFQPHQPGSDDESREDELCGGLGGGLCRGSHFSQLSNKMLLNEA